MPHRERVVALAFSPDGRYVITGGFDHNARLMNAANGRETWHFGQEGNVYAVAYSPDSRFVAVGSAAGTDGYAWVVDARTGRSVSGLLHEGPVFAVAFSPDSKYLATASADHTARVILTETGKEISRLQHQD